ncbi:guanylate kinase [Sporobacter termitidis DSM 10068]|uniref:Guanylate kinase n=2 Tax=Sporobacter TaxID=44748 RepID=A0A1M5TIW8_9FIRM|nr:guanylate kinase [Sporobacter termitidis DSM 10068]
MNDNRRGRLFIISAPSGTGKSTVIKRLMELRDDLYFSVSATTRAARAGEEEGVAYHFLSHDAFDTHVRNNEFLEYAEYIGDFYGTLKKPVLDHLDSGNDIILDIDVQGCKQVKNAMPEAVTIFLVPPSLEELERRLRNRGTDSEEKMLKRLARARTELTEKTAYDHTIVNDDVHRAATEILDIMKHE